MNKDLSLGEHGEAFLRYKRAMGYDYRQGEYELKGYLSFVSENYPDISIPGRDDVESYLLSKQDTTYGVINATGILREFSRFLKISGYEDAYVIPPKRVKKPTPEPPYFFTDKEISAFFYQCDRIPVHRKPHTKGRNIVLPALFRTIYCCGLRCKEARMLKKADVHLQEGFIDVLESKGPKSRRIFISEELSEYLEKFDNEIMLLFPDRKYFFPSPSNSCYSGSAIDSNFIRIWHEAFPDFVRKGRPRVYDFRHHFAYANINRWVAEGKDVNAMIPYLVRYMGHKTLDETLYYFHFVPDFFPDFKKITSALEDRLPEVVYE